MFTGAMAHASPRPLRRFPRGVNLVFVILAAGALAGCGGSSQSGQTTDRPTPAPAAAKLAKAGAAGKDGATRKGRATRQAAASEPKARSRHAKVKAIAPTHASQSTVARVDASSDATLVAAAGQATVSAGAPSDAEVRREIEQAAQEGIQLPTGNTSASFAQSAAEISISDAEAVAVGASIPVAVWNPARKPIADWIVPVLQWAYEHGWTGTVTSGYRTYLEQAELNAAGDFSAPAGTSNHESTEYPGGAVDVTNPSQLIAVLATYPGPEKLHGGVLGPIDPEHFSATGE